MKTYTDHVIENKTAKTRAKSGEKKQMLRDLIKDKFGYNAPKCLTIKDLNMIFAQDDV